MRIISFLIVVSSLFVSCKSDKKKNEPADVYKKSKMTIEEIEKKDPLQFLSINAKEKHNLIGQTVVKGEITSKATAVTYKDITVSIRFISKTGAALEEDEEVVYEELKPGSSVDFKSKFFAPKGTADVKLKIVKAASVH